MKKTLSALASLMLTGFCPLPQQAQAWVGVRIGFGLPIYVGPGPYYYGPPYYPPTYITPAPQVVYQAAPMNVATPPGPVLREPIPPPSQKEAIAVPQSIEATPAPLSQNAVPPPLPSVTNVTPVNNPSSPQVDALVQQLSQASETSRRDVALQLGRMKASIAVYALVNILAKDTSPIAREGAARALGLIAAPTSLQALIHAAQADDDREVRRSAQFAVEVIRSNLRGN
jgi:hypothetical protein